MTSPSYEEHGVVRFVVEGGGARERETAGNEPFAQHAPPQ